MSAKPSFPQRLRRELFASLRDARQEAPLAVQVTALAAFHFSGHELRYNSHDGLFVSWLAQRLHQIYGVEVPLQRGKEQLSLLLRKAAEVRRIKETTDAFAADPSPLTQLAAVLPLPEAAQSRLQVVLAALYLAAGSLQSPDRAYQLEFALQRRSAVDCFLPLFERLDIETRYLRHQGYHVLYLKDSQAIADFLLYAGAHQSLLRLESLRVKKEVLNNVNRQVNCDAANADRLASSSARQRLAIQQLADSGRLASLPEPLRAAARARLAYPELSLSELGLRMHPPLGKSGMNHRLKKVLEAADELAESPKPEQDAASDASSVL